MDSPIASLSLTHVHYVSPHPSCLLTFGVWRSSNENPDDPISYVAAFLALVPQALCVAYVSLIWATRELEIILMFGGQVLCEVLNFALKRIIQEERPPRTYGNGYGMPSSHSQFVAFFAFSITLFLLLRHVPDTSNNHSPLSYIQRVGVSFLACAGAGIVAASRVYLNYHTPKQVFAGVSAGVVFGALWFSFTSYLRQAGWTDWALDGQLCRMARMRDLVLGEDLAEAGWQRWEEMRRQKRKRAVNNHQKSL